MVFNRYMMQNLKHHFAWQVTEHNGNGWKEQKKMMRRNKKEREELNDRVDGDDGEKRRMLSIYLHEVVIVPTFYTF